MFEDQTLLQAHPEMPIPDILTYFEHCHIYWITKHFRVCRKVQTYICTA